MLNNAGILTNVAAVDSAAVLSISGTPVTTAVHNTPYTGFTVHGSGGLAPYAYSVTAGTLPTGITLNSGTGAVAGTPTTVQDEIGIVITVTDHRGAIANLPPFAINVT